MAWHIASDPRDLIRARGTIGDAEITICTDGTCRMDGGAMFGVVPKPLWSKRAPADDRNRIELGLNCVVVRIAGKIVLIETGFGNKLTPKLRELYDTQERLPQSLAAAGLTPESIDIVINSHLHWDHCGWNSVLGKDGLARPFFPRAQYLADRGEVEHGRLQHDRDRISYVPDNYEPMIATGQMRLLDTPADATSRTEILPGLSVECFPGHTAHMMVVHIESGGEHACFTGDLLPTSAHLDVTWAMGFDLDPIRTIDERKRFYRRAIPERWWLLFPHDHGLPVTRVDMDEKGRPVTESISEVT